MQHAEYIQSPFIISFQTLSQEKETDRLLKKN